MISIEEKYPNICKFLKESGFKIIKLELTSIIFCFENELILKALAEFKNEIREADEIHDLDSQSQAYKNAHLKREKVLTPAFYKTQPIINKLNEFYSHRKSELEFMIYFDNSILSKMTLGGGRVYAEIFHSLGKSIEFDLKIAKELELFDKFIKES